MRWGVFDWAGNRLFPDKTWKSFEDAWDFIFGRFDDERDYEDLYVEII